MNDTGLDDLFSASIAPLPASVTREAISLAVETKPPRLRRGRMPRRRWMIPVIVVGSLTAGMSLSTYQLSVWPWVTMPEGNTQTIPIPVDFTTESGHFESCRAYVELRNWSDSNLAALNDAVRTTDWTGFGQQLYDESATVDDDPDGEKRVGQALTPALFEFTKAAIPGVVVFNEPGKGVGIDAVGMSCRLDNP